MSGPDTGVIRFKREATARLDTLTDLVVGTGEKPGLCESIRALEAEQANMRSDIRQLCTNVNSFGAKLDALVITGSRPAERRKRVTEFFTKSRVRAVVFTIGALGAIFEAVKFSYTNTDNLSLSHLLGTAFTALAAFALRWPGDKPKEGSEPPA